MKVIRFAGRLLVTAGIVFSAGCGTTYVLRVDTDRPATVYINGDNRGTSNRDFVVEFGDSQKLILQVAAEDYKPERDVLEREIFERAGGTYRKAYNLRN